MSSPIAVRHVARVTLELVSPFLVASGRGSDFSDAVPVVDANGLPAIPGSSLGGLLRHAFAAAHGKERAAALFGSEPKKKASDGGGGEGNAPDAWGSRLWITWGHLHDSADRPVEGLLADGLPGDPVLDNARALSVRDHVRISHRGAAAGGGKFDQAVVPAGHRFTFDLVLEGPAEAPHDEEDFEWLLRFLASGRARLGGAGRRGLGAFRVARCRRRRFDLRRPEDARDFCRLPVALDAPVPQLEAYEPPPLDDDGQWRTLDLELEAEDYWAFHGAEPWILDGESEPPDFNPVREERIEWADARGSVSEPRLLVPGSALKGPIAHRVAFHDNLARGRNVEEAGPDGLQALTGQENPAVRQLFGSLHQESEGRATGNAGRVVIDDVWLPEKTRGRLHRLMHTSIDRFTGGVRAGVLFEERAIYKGPPLTLRIAVERFDDLEPATRCAFREALRDLAEGRLALGAGGGRGHGYFQSREPFDSLWNEFVGGNG